MICPNCFQRHIVAEFSYTCTHSKCGRAGLPVTHDKILMQDGNPLCPGCRSALIERLCPSCGYPVIIDDDTVPTVPISIVGAEGCGKSNYLSVLIDQLRRKISKSYSCAFYPIGGDETIKNYDTKYYQPLFVKGQCLTSTMQEEVSPLLYSMVFSGDYPSGKNCNITLYDACGANFRSEKIMADYNRSIYNAKGILYFIDPFQISAVRDNLSNIGRPVSNDDAGTLLSRTIHLIRQGSNRKNLRRKIDIPIAVCITKMDMIRPLLDVSSFALSPSRHDKNGKFDVHDFASTSLEVQSILESWSESEIVNQITSQFSDYGFFALSSLGTAPDDTNAVENIVPHRVIDPMMWLLWKNKIIEANE